MDWYLMVLQKYATFEGRARRKEFWYFNLVNTGVLITLFALMWATQSMIAAVLYLGYAVASIIPGLGVMVRRLHDTGRSGWWMLVGFIPIVGPFLNLVLMLLDSTPGPNAYGPSPKAPAAFVPPVAVI